MPAVYVTVSHRTCGRTERRRRATNRRAEVGFVSAAGAMLTSVPAVVSPLIQVLEYAKRNTRFLASVRRNSQSFGRAHQGSTRGIQLPVCPIQPVDYIRWCPNPSSDTFSEY